MRRFIRSSEEGFTFIELLAVVLLLGILIIAALPNYFGAESTARQKVDQSNVRAINAALALYKFKSTTGLCPGQGSEITFGSFLTSGTYFPDGTPVDPHDVDGTPDGDDYTATYDPALCRVKMSSGTLDHTTGGGHD